MPQTSFPASAVFLSGPRVVGKTGSGFGLADELEVKTINGNSIFGSGNLSISATPAGSSTQLQFNSSGSFAGSSNLLWDGTAVRIKTPELATDQGSGYIMRFLPPGARDNKPFNIVSGVSENPNGSWNFGVNIGFNAAPGGGAEDEDVSGFWLAFEENWQTTVDSTPSRLKEYHTCFSPSATTTAWGWTKNSHIRLVSWEVNETTGSVTQFQSSSNFSIRLPRSTSNGATWFALQPGQLYISDATNTHSLTIEPSGGYVNYSGSHLHLFANAMQCQSNFTVLGYIDCRSTIGATGAISSTSTSGNAIAADNGGIFARKAVATGTAMWIYAHAVQGSPTSEPAAVGDAVVLFTRINSGSYELWAKFQNNTVKKLADDT
jgi:hypothetical protein